MPSDHALNQRFQAEQAMPTNISDTLEGHTTMERTGFPVVAWKEVECNYDNTHLPPFIQEGLMAVPGYRLQVFLSGNHGRPQLKYAKAGDLVCRVWGHHRYWTYEDEDGKQQFCAKGFQCGFSDARKGMAFYFWHGKSDLERHQKSNGFSEHPNAWLFYMNERTKELRRDANWDLDKLEPSPKVVAKKGRTSFNSGGLGELLNSTFNAKPEPRKSQLSRQISIVRESRSSSTSSLCSAVPAPSKRIPKKLASQRRDASLQRRSRSPEREGIGRSVTTIPAREPRLSQDSPQAKTLAPLLIQTVYQNTDLLVICAETDSRVHYPLSQSTTFRGFYEYAVHTCRLTYREDDIKAFVFSSSFLDENMYMQKGFENSFQVFLARLENATHWDDYERPEKMSRQKSLLVKVTIVLKTEEQKNRMIQVSQRPRCGL